MPVDGTWASQKQSNVNSTERITAMMELSLAGEDIIESVEEQKILGIRVSLYFNSTNRFGPPEDDPNPQASTPIIRSDRKRENTRPARKHEPIHIPRH
jgi:hypothetical protein